MFAKIVAFFNTTKEVNPKLEESISKAKAQRKIILQLFEANPDRLYSGSMVQKETGYLIVSCRRVITLLNQEGKIVRIGKTICPETNSSEYTYVLRK
jgi:hypothetical protein